MKPIKCRVGAKTPASRLCGRAVAASCVAASQLAALLLIDNVRRGKACLKL